VCPAMCARCSTRAVVLAKVDDLDIWLWVPTFAPWHMGLPAGYDVWAKVIEALADIGYDTSTMVALPYDWRLSVPNLEFRDGYFTRLRFQVQIHSPVASHCTAAVNKSALSCDWADGISRCWFTGSSAVPAPVETFGLFAILAVHALARLFTHVAKHDMLAVHVVKASSGPPPSANR
jgi:Lecithin:cholesterol acyltransferase